MAYASLERFRDITGRNVLALQQAKEAGKKVVGQYCIYSPLEIALAAGAIPVSLCGTKNDSIPVAETMLPRSLCPLIKSSFGFALQDSCPYLAASDIVVADTTCDGKKKMYELLAGRTAPASADSGRGRQGLLARPVRQARREAGKGFRRLHHHGRSAGCRPADQPAPPSPQGCP